MNKLKPKSSQTVSAIMLDQSMFPVYIQNCVGAFYNVEPTDSVWQDFRKFQTERAEPKVFILKIRSK